MLQTVTQVCRSISQPRGGYINPSDFEVVSFDDGVSLYEQENISPGFVGMVVDYIDHSKLFVVERRLSSREMDELFQLSE